jgi:sugar phosphate isomerase/epimerase
VVQARLGLTDRHAWFPRLSDRTIGCHLHDVDGLADHRAPGNGDVDWSYLAAGIPKSALKVFEINQGQPDDLVAAAIPFLGSQGVL